MKYILKDLAYYLARTSEDRLLVTYEQIETIKEEFSELKSRLNKMKQRIEKETNTSLSHPLNIKIVPPEDCYDEIKLSTENQ